jgi:hypothetical protein
VQMSQDAPDDGEDYAHWLEGTLALLREAGLGDEADALEEELAPDGPVQMAMGGAQRAPKGGIELNGRKYRGGQYIPAKEIEAASPADKARLAAAKEASDASRKGRDEARAAKGDVDAAGLAGRLKAHADTHGELAGWEKRQAAASARMIHRHHGAMALHRIDEIASLLEKAHAATDDQDLQGRLSRRLAMLHQSAEAVRAAGVEGKVPEGMKAKAPEPAKALSQLEVGRMMHRIRAGQLPPDAVPPDVLAQHPVHHAEHVVRTAMKGEPRPQPVESVAVAGKGGRTISVTLPDHRRLYPKDGQPGKYAVVLSRKGAAGTPQELAPGSVVRVDGKQMVVAKASKPRLHRHELSNASMQDVEVREPTAQELHAIGQIEASQEAASLWQQLSSPEAWWETPAKAQEQLAKYQAAKEAAAAPFVPPEAPPAKEKKPRKPKAEHPAPQPQPAAPAASQARPEEIRNMKPQMRDGGQAKTPRDGAVADWQDADSRERRLQERLASPSLQLIKDTNAGRNETRDLEEKLAKIGKAKAKAEKVINAQQPQQPGSPSAGGAAGFTGTDSQGREWRDGELVARQEENSGTAISVEPSEEKPGPARQSGQPSPAEPRPSNQENDSPAGKPHGLTFKEFMRAPRDWDFIRQMDGLKAEIPPELEAAREKQQQAEQAAEAAGITSYDIDGKNPPLKSKAKRELVENVKNARAEAGRLHDASREAIQRSLHRQAVQRALAAGKPVPPEVLADYPDLAQPAAKPAEAPAPAAATPAPAQPAASPFARSITPGGNDEPHYRAAEAALAKEPPPAGKDFAGLPAAQQDEEAGRAAKILEEAFAQQGGLVKVHDVADAVRSRFPGATPQQVRQALERMQEQDRLTLGLVNDREAEARAGEMYETPRGLRGYVSLRPGAGEARAAPAPAAQPVAPPAEAPAAAPAAPAPSALAGVDMAALKPAKVYGLVGRGGRAVADAILASRPDLADEVAEALADAEGQEEAPATAQGLRDRAAREKAAAPAPAAGGVAPAGLDDHPLGQTPQAIRQGLDRLVKEGEGNDYKGRVLARIEHGRRMQARTLQSVLVEQEPAILSSAVEAMAAAQKANPFREPKIQDVYIAVRAAHPGLSMADFHSILARGHAAGHVRLGAFTEAPATIPDSDIASVLPMDGDLKLYAAVGAKPLPEGKR